MTTYLANKWIKIGLAIVVLGWGPLLSILVLAFIGLWPDPNPNPIGPGLLFFLTVWPAIICLGIGVSQVKRTGSGDEGTASAVAIKQERGRGLEWIQHPAVRVVAGLAGVGLFVVGALGRAGGGARGEIAVMLLGVVVGYWAVTGRIPTWIRK